MYLSKSSMNSYQMCPKKFEFGYVQKIKTETSPQAQRGIDVHRFCNEFYDNIAFIDDSYIVNPDFKENFLSKCSIEACEQIENFLQFEQRRWEICKSLEPSNPKKYFIPLLRESKLVSDKLEQVTILDRMDLRTDGNYTIVEIKTEKFNPKGWKQTEFRRELMFEKITAETSPEFQKNFNGDIVDFVVYFPRSNDVFTENFNSRTASALSRCLEKMRENIKVGTYECNVDYHCRFCWFSNKCNMEMPLR
jgi:hypothetical protein